MFGLYSFPQWFRSKLPITDVAQKQERLNVLLLVLLSCDACVLLNQNLIRRIKVCLDGLQVNYLQLKYLTNSITLLASLASQYLKQQSIYL